MKWFVEEFIKEIHSNTCWSDSHWCRKNSTNCGLKNNLKVWFKALQKCGLKTFQKCGLKTFRKNFKSVVSKHFKSVDYKTFPQAIQKWGGGGGRGSFFRLIFRRCMVDVVCRHICTYISYIYALMV